MLYAIKEPCGDLLHETMADNKYESWDLCFSYVAAEDKEFQTKYWKRREPARQCLRGRGYKCVPVKLIELNARSK